MAKKIVTMLSSQTVIDLALQVQGDATKVIDLIQDNSDLDNIHSGVAGIQVEYEEQTLSITEFFRKNSINLVSGFPTIGGEELSNWILASGFWVDTKAWVDTEFWID